MPNSGERQWGSGMFLDMPNCILWTSTLALAAESALWSDKVGLSGISGFTMDIPMRSFVISFFRFELMENAYGTMFFGVYIPGAFVADKVSGNSAPCLSECQGTILDFSILG